MSLADCFPEEIRTAFAERNIDVGVAILIRMPFNVSYDKYVIYIAHDVNDNEKCGVVVINSEINEHINHNLYLRSQHVLIDSIRHGFLERDSYIDCTKIHPQIKQNIISHITNDPSSVCGNVSEDVLLAVLNKLTHSHTLSKRDKRKYGLL